jgi:hypothetical protein
VKRLLQFGTLIFLLVTFLTPLAECLDRWDAPGIWNDTEFAVFVLILSLCLVLLVSRLVSALALLIQLVVDPHLRRVEQLLMVQVESVLAFLVPPLPSSPLRI